MSLAWKYFGKLLFFLVMTLALKTSERTGLYSGGEVIYLRLWSFVPNAFSIFNHEYCEILDLIVGLVFFKGFFFLLIRGFSTNWFSVSGHKLIVLVCYDTLSLSLPPFLAAHSALTSQWIVRHCSFIFHKGNSQRVS